jgi:hypothetical protein
MRYKTLPPALLLTALLTPVIYGQTPPESPDGRNNGYGIELEASYPGRTVLEILLAAESEIDTAVNEAYEAGYKAAALRYEPEIAGLRDANRTIALSLDAERKKTTYSRLTVLIAGGLSFLGGFLTHTLVTR